MQKMSSRFAFRLFAVVLVVVTLSLGGCAHTSTMPDEQEIQALEKEFARATAEEDLAALERILAEEVVRIHSTGLVSDKALFLSELREKTRDFKRLDVVHRKVSFPTPDVALVTGESALEMVHEGKATESRSLVSHVWIKRDGRWQLLSAHYSHIGK